VFFSKKGNYLFTVGKKGSAEGSFNAPVGIGSDEKGNILVADTNNHRIQIFNREGKFKTSFQIEENGELIRPIDVVADSMSELIFVTGNNNHKVMVYGKNGNLLKVWGGNGAEDGEFRYPATIALMPNNRLGVVDVMNTRLQVFTQGGDHVIHIGGWGVLAGQLFRPKGVAVDSKHNVYLSDSYLNVVQVFSDEGKFLHVLEFSSTGRTLDTPTGLAVSEDRLYVVEMMANRVSAFRIDSGQP
jgi:tripartite motif-containing protein 71